jgi:hypothetical protein
MLRRVPLDAVVNEGNVDEKLSSFEEFFDEIWVVGWGTENGYSRNNRRDKRCAPIIQQRYPENNTEKC